MLILRKRHKQFQAPLARRKEKSVNSTFQHYALVRMAIKQQFSFFQACAPKLCPLVRETLLVQPEREHQRKLSKRKVIGMSQDNINITTQFGQKIHETIN